MNTAVNKPIGVLLMAHGGPAKLADIGGYLCNIRTMVPTRSAAIKQFQNQYQQIGGYSPLLEYSLQQLSALQSYLDPSQFRCYLGMRYWPPYIEETVAQMIEDGVEKAVALVLAPQYSKLSVAKYQKQIKDGLSLYRGDIDFKFVEAFYNNPDFIEALKQRLLDGLKLWNDQQDQVFIVFCAHSIPERVATSGDVYPQQVQQTAHLLAESLSLKADQWRFCYQSQGMSPEPWLGPSVEQTLEELKQKNIDKVLLFPVGFVSDHSETLFDLDIEAKTVAQQLGVEVKRPPALNNQPQFIQSLANIIQTESHPWMSVHD